MQKPFSVIVNYEQSFEEMVALGKYTVRDLGVSEINFSLQQGSGVCSVDLYLVNFGFLLRLRDITKCLCDLGFKPAGIRHLLAFGATYPEEQMEVFPIVALGGLNPDGRGNCIVPYLTRGSFGRFLSMRPSVPENVWSGNCMFLSLLF